MDSLSININLSENVLRTLAGFLADALRERETRETRENREKRETRKETKEEDEKVTKEEEKESVVKSVEIKENKESVENKEKENASAIIAPLANANANKNTCNFLRVLANSDSVSIGGESVLANSEDKANNPPTLKEVHDYILSKCYDLSAEKFYRYYSVNNWRSKGGDSILSDWKRVVDKWADKEFIKNPNGKTVRASERYLAPTNFDD